MALKTNSSNCPGRKKYEVLIQHAKNELDNNTSWKSRWQQYAKAIDKQRVNVCNNYKKFKEWGNLRRHVSVSSVLDPHVNFSIRFKGQEVGKISVDNNGMAHLNTTIKHCASNSRYFGFNGTPQKIPWKDAKKFREHFSNWSGNKYSEHMIEALVLEEMENPSRIKFNRSFRGIQPVRLYNKLPFQMPVPLSGNRGLPKFQRGNIDILARTGIGRGTRLCIIELKKEGVNKSDRPIAQALIYTVCIANLLLNDNTWWNIFSFKGKVPKPLNLFAVAMLPYNRKDEYDKEFKDLELPPQIKNPLVSEEFDMNGNKNVRIIVRPFFYKLTGTTITIVK